MKNRKFMVFGFLSTVAAISLSLSPSLLMAQSEEGGPTVEASRLQSLAKFTKVLGIVERYNVDELTIEELMDKAMQGMMTNLDAHSNYLNEKSFENMKIQTSGEFGGLGITVGIKDGALTVIAPIEGTPADEAGMQAGDIILKINEESTLNMTIDEAVNRMRGKPKTPIELTVVRKGEPDPVVVNIIRDIIKIQSVYAKQIGENILYLRVTSFDQKVVTDITRELKKHLDHDQGIILDLRNNPGGLLDQAVGLVDLFVDEGDIVSQKGREASENKYYKASSEGTVTSNTPIVVLVNGGSASASEIVSGALQDHKRAVVVGENTFGKGSVQVILPITDNEAIKLTVARYYLPSGRTIQAVGVAPDITVRPGEVTNHGEDAFAIKEADLKKHLKGELEKVNGNGEAHKKAEEEKDKTVITEQQLNKDIQLKEAVDIMKALIIMKGK
jgi:carboxyl-terminal processing protease